MRPKARNGGDDLVAQRRPKPVADQRREIHLAPAPSRAPNSSFPRWMIVLGLIVYCSAGWALLWCVGGWALTALRGLASGASFYP